MKKPLYVFATDFEAQVLLEQGQSDIHITGIGPIPAAVSLTEHLGNHSYTEVINIGFAGSLKNHQQFGEFYEIDRLGKEHHPALFADTLQQFPTASLVTSDVPIHDEETRQRLALEYDLVDMEGWAIAWSCAQLKIPCRFIKIVSDFCSPTTSEEIMEKARELSTLIFERLFLNKK